MLNEFTSNFANELYHLTNQSFAAKFFKKYVEKLNNKDFKDLAEIINAILRHFKLGPTCDFIGKIGSFPTREEFCQMKLGQTYTKNAMMCHHQTTEDDHHSDRTKNIIRVHGT